MLEVASRRVRVNFVCPGAVATPLLRRLYGEAVVAETAVANPLGRIAGPEDVAATVAFLVSEEARHDGVALRLDGGEAVTRTL